MRRKMSLWLAIWPFLALQGWADGKPVLQRVFETSLDRAYAAEVKAAGPALKAAVKEACMVNFETREYSGNYHRVIFWTAVCKDGGQGRVVITLSEQMDSTNLFGNGKAIKKDADRFWSNIGADLKNAGPANPAPSTSNQAAPSISSTLHVVSDPTGADITVDGDYVGSTPSDVKLSPDRTRSRSRRGATTTGKNR